MNNLTLLAEFLKTYLDAFEREAVECKANQAEIKETLLAAGIDMAVVKAIMYGDDAATMAEDGLFEVHPPEQAAVRLALVDDEWRVINDETGDTLIAKAQYRDARKAALRAGFRIIDGR